MDVLKITCVDCYFPNGSMLANKLLVQVFIDKERVCWPLVEKETKNI